MYSFLALFVIISASAVQSLDYSICKKVECMDYKVLEKKDKYEVRQYDEHKLATIKSELNPIIANMVNFRTLFKFIRGANDKHQRIHMTVPVVHVCNIDEETGKIDMKEQTMGFFMPKAVQSAVPTPTNKKIEITDFGPAKVYAVSFTGYAHPYKVIMLQKKLHDDLKAAGIEFDESYFFVAEYNPPFQFWNRHNDIFYLALE